MDERKDKEAVCEAEEELPAPEAEEDGQTPQEPYKPRPLAFRIFALALAALVIVGLILYYYNIFTAGR